MKFFLLSVLSFFCLGLAHAGSCGIDPFCPVETLDKEFGYADYQLQLVTISQQLKEYGKDSILNQVVLVGAQDGHIGADRILIDQRRTDVFDANLRASGGSHINRYSVIGTPSAPKAVLGYLSRYFHSAPDRLPNDPIVVLIPLREQWKEIKPRVLLDQKIVASTFKHFCGKSFPKLELFSLYVENGEVDFESEKIFRVSLLPRYAQSFVLKYDGSKDEVVLGSCPNY